MILGYFASVFMGFVLGLVGGGGSILTVPILVFLFSVPTVEATAYSLVIVGFSAIVAFADYYKRELFHLKTGILFAVPGTIGVYSMRRFILPQIPEEIATFGFSVTKDNFVLWTFMLIMIFAGISMIRKKEKANLKNNKKSEGPNFLASPKLKTAIVALEGLFIGGLTGFVGAGGGFLLIPALVLLAGLEMKVAVGTSLLIISVKSLIGFLGDIQVMEAVNWALVGGIIVSSLIGIFIGTLASRKIPNSKLKPAFGWFVLAMAAAMAIGKV